MEVKLENPLIVQSDRSLLLEVQNPLYEQARDAISPFCELIKSPEFIHTYRITSLSIWNAAAAGVTPVQMCSALIQFAKYGVPERLLDEIQDYASRYGMLKLERLDERLFLTSPDPLLLTELLRFRDLCSLLGEERTDYSVEVASYARGILKQELIRLGYPVQDIAGYIQGASLTLSFKADLRDYQSQAVESYYAGGSEFGGSGVLVLPCGAGKTVIGIAAMVKTGMETLILTTNVTSVRQWIQEILAKTDLTEDQVGEYSGNQKEVKPVTVSTYQMLTYRTGREADFTHIDLFSQRNWGFIIYDEVHMLPAPVFRVTADIQAKRRLGLTATLVREDGREEDVFTLVGPKKYDMPWKELEKKGWIAEANCSEIRISMSFSLREEYIYASTRQKSRVAAENPEKKRVVQQIIDQHERDQVLIIGQYVDQLEELSKELKIPVITGKTPQEERDRLYAKFRRSELKRLIVSKVANFAVDLPDANVAIQISGTFGSRQEEAQRLGRVLRPKEENTAYFYTLVSKGTKEEEWARKRQMFLVEQGYQYRVLDAESLHRG
ncbi:DNA repair helicase XPB [Ammoniphilus sp. CFH 90114]|uniref:DNA repair helicase XPB n=1 Tax=Ammoniphilus sp. CFH 90114 TaxID=2493665 RepID=UPI00100F65A3|nr:DNA repair helicase XPB [Ammoniphilus sp. CFH 90114]RXT13869.1 helicase [Ammoniphilus sp. CFH 90114]